MASRCFWVSSGCTQPASPTAKGGLTWVGDTYDLATGDGIAGAPRVAGLSYHQYHEDAFALYYGSGPVNPNNANRLSIDRLTTTFQATP